MDFLCSIATCHEIDFLGRRFLRDPDDDMLLELAAQAGGQRIVTHDGGDFDGCRAFGVVPTSPREFLKRIGALP